MKGKYLLPLILALLLGLVVPAAAVSIPGPGTGPVSAKVEVTPATVYSGDTVTAKVTLTNPPIFAVTYAYAWHLPSGTFSNESESPSDSFSVLSVGEASVTVSVYNKLTKGLITTSNVATFTVLPDPLEGFTYEEHVAGSMRIKAYTGSAAEVQVPSHIKSLPVTMIGAQAFAKRLGITKVVLPSTIETIEYNAFDGCSLQSINLPEGLRTIENGVFYRCPQLRSITLPASLKAVSPFAFSECESLSSVTLPEGLLTISSDAFSGCPSLASISLPSTLTAIGTSAFSGCKALSAITIPDKVSLLEDFTFLGCSSLSQVRLPAPP